VLAAAGLRRLGLASRATEVLDSEVCLPAVGQGALGIECREDDAEIRALLRALHDETTSRCVAAERGVLLALEGDCRTPLAAHAERVAASGAGAHDLRLRAFVSEADGARYRAFEDRIAWPESDAEAGELGARVGRRLLSSLPEDDT
jgi:hydroxymethylbilane synthase